MSSYFSDSVYLERERRERLAREREERLAVLSDLTEAFRTRDNTIAALRDEHSRLIKAATGAEELSAVRNQIDKSFSNAFQRLKALQMPELPSAENHDEYMNEANAALERITSAIKSATDSLFEETQYCREVISQHWQNQEAADRINALHFQKENEWVLTADMMDSLLKTPLQSMHTVVSSSRATEETLRYENVTKLLALFSDNVFSERKEANTIPSMLSRLEVAYETGGDALRKVLREAVQLVCALYDDEKLYKRYVDLHAYHHQQGAEETLRSMKTIRNQDEIQQLIDRLSHQIACKEEQLYIQQTLRTVLAKHGYNQLLPIDLSGGGVFVHHIALGENNPCLHVARKQGTDEIIMQLAEVSLASESNISSVCAGTHERKDNCTTHFTNEQIAFCAQHETMEKELKECGVILKRSPDFPRKAGATSFQIHFTSVAPEAIDQLTKLARTPIPLEDHVIAFNEQERML